MDDCITTSPSWPGPEDEPRWQLPVRRDLKPHRGDTLRWLGVAAVAAGIIGFLGPLVAIGSPVAVVLGLTVRTLATRDQERMWRGLLDPRGWDLTERARELGGTAAVFGACALALVAALLFFGFACVWIGITRK